MSHATAIMPRASIHSPRNPGDSGGGVVKGRERGEPMPAAVVVTVTVTLAAVLPTVSGFGATVQVACEGAPEQVNVTVPLIPPCPPTLKVKLAA